MGHERRADKIPLEQLLWPEAVQRKQRLQECTNGASAQLDVSRTGPSLCFKNPVLAAFSNAIWHCAAAAEVCATLNEAAAKTPELERAEVASPQAFRESGKKIVSDLAELMATGDMKPDAFYDVSVLPHPKEDILLAIEREVLSEPTDARVEWLTVGAAFLPSFQQ